MATWKGTMPTPLLTLDGPQLRLRHVSLSLADMHTARHLNPVDGAIDHIKRSTGRVGACGDSEWCAGLCSPCRRVAPLLHERLIYLWVNSNFNLQVLGAGRRPVPVPLPTAVHDTCLLPAAIVGACSLCGSVRISNLDLGSRAAQRASSTRSKQVRLEATTDRPQYG